MPSLSDIPDAFMDKRLKLPFIAWLNVLPVTDETRKALLRLWGHWTGEQLTQDDYQKITLGE